MIENPTQEQLKTLKMIVYMIENMIDHKKYIGVTENSFYRRYSSGKWWKYPSNNYIKNAVKKYGIQSFQIKFIEFCVESNETLNKLEIEYIKKFNTLYPNGYNYFSGGDKIQHTEATKLAIGETHSKDYTFYDHKLEKIVNIHNLSKFCKQNNLSDPLMTNVYQGKRKRHCQFTKPGTIIKKWKLKSPNNNIFIILEGELTKFCIKNNIHKVGVNQLCCGKWKSYKGWTCPDFKFEPLKTYKIKSPLKIIYEIKHGNVTNFCYQNNLSPSSIFSVLNKRSIQHKGWTLPETKIDIYKIINPHNEIIEIPKIMGSVKKFCNQNNLNYRKICSVVFGNCQNSNGWRKINSKLKFYKIISPTNNIHEIPYRKIKEFCEKNNLNPSCIYGLIFGNYKQFNGWKFLEIITR